MVPPSFPLQVLILLKKFSALSHVYWVIYEVLGQVFLCTFPLSFLVDLQVFFSVPDTSPLSDVFATCI